MTRVDEQEIHGVSENFEDAPDLVEIRTSNRGRVPKRQWPEEETPKSRKKRRTQLPTPTSTQQTAVLNIITRRD